MNTTESPKKIEIHIRPEQGWFNFDWKGLIDYRDLLFLLVRRDFVSRYQQTILGPLWFVINPLISAIMNVLVLGVVIGVSTDGTPALLFFLCGQITWSYFATILDATGNTFTGNVNIFGKVYFPRLIVPLASAISTLFNFGIQLASFLAIWGWMKLHPSDKFHFALDPTTLALFPLFLIHMAALALGAGMIISTFTVKYRDFRYLSGFLTQIWMMASAVWYPLSRLFEKLPEKWHWIVILNPMACIVEGPRRAFLGAASFNPTYYVISAGLTLVLFLVGLILFQRSARTFVDTV